MIGGIVLRKCLESDAVAKVVSVVRKNSKVIHPKLTEVVMDDFLDYSQVEDHLTGLDIAYFCLGVYTGAVPDKKFREITVDYTIAFADLFYKHNPDGAFCFLSGQGADNTEKSRMSFAKYKGMAENNLLARGSDKLFIFRPGYIYPVEPRTEPNFSYSLMRTMYPLIKKLAPGMGVKSEELGEAMFRAGIDGASKTILENADIRDLARGEE